MCTVCHHNHDQDQIYTGKNDKNIFFIVTGTLDTGAPTPLDYDSGTNTTTIAYATLAATNPSSDWPVTQDCSTCPTLKIPVP